MSRIRRVFKVLGVSLLVLVLLLAGAGYFVYQSIAGEGESAIERWIGGQVVAIANSYLNPQLEFTTLDYQAPRTLVLEGVTLRADPITADNPPDRPTIAETPATESQGEDPPAPTADPGAIARIGKLTLELTEIPSVGQPLQIEKLVIDEPRVNLIAPDPEQPFSFLGFSQLLKAEPDPNAQHQPGKLSEMFRIRRVELNDGRVEYDILGDDNPAMVLNQINTQLDVVPQTDESGALWHTIETSLTRAPVFNLDLAGRVNLDDMLVDVNNLKLDTRLGREYDDVLPPQITELLRQHEVTGELSLTASGRINANDPMTSSLQSELQLRDANVASGDYKLPVPYVNLAASASDGLADIEILDIATLGGSILIDGQARYDDPAYPADLSLQIDDIRLEDAVRSGAQPDDPNTPPSLAGLVRGQVAVNAPLAQVMTQTQGRGQIDVVDAQLARIPIIAQLRSAVNAVTDIALGTDNAKKAGSDAAKLVFEFQGNKIHFSDIRVTSTFIAARGAGDVFFDQQLDVTIRGGPLEKLEQNLGPLGVVVGAVSSNLARYRITGTVAEPKIGVIVAGGAVNMITGAASGAVNAATGAASGAVNAVTGNNDNQSSNSNNEEQ